MKRKRKIKYLEPRMKFNPGTGKFEPDLPLRSITRKTKGKEKNLWFWMILLIVLVIILVTILFLM